uniref:Utp12 domain-containing protein n=2 Tax=Macrostomum lignano TaxID=282301 RepID=A0A1I8GAX5_9PLAT
FLFQQAMKKSPAVKAALIDGLLSDSATHIHMLLQSQDRQLMSDTMQQLAQNPKSIDAFLRILTELVAKHPQSASQALQWLNRLVETHSGYIMSSPDLINRLGQLRSQLQTRLASMQRLLMLKGRLDLLLSLTDNRRAVAANGTDACARQKPAVTHRDSDSELTESSDGEAGDGSEAEEPDDLAGQLLGNVGSSSGSEAGPDDYLDDAEDGDVDMSDEDASEGDGEEGEGGSEDAEGDSDDEEFEDDEEGSGFSSDEAAGGGASKRAALSG